MEAVGVLAKLTRFAALHCSYPMYCRQCLRRSRFCRYFRGIIPSFFGLVHLVILFFFSLPFVHFLLFFFKLLLATSRLLCWFHFYPKIHLIFMLKSIFVHNFRSTKINVCNTLWRHIHSSIRVNNASIDILKYTFDCLTEIKCIKYGYKRVV